jgi:hypothetical protein
MDDRILGRFLRTLTVDLDFDEVLILQPTEHRATTCDGHSVALPRAERSRVRAHEARQKHVATQVLEIILHALPPRIL